MDSAPYTDAQHDECPVVPFQDALRQALFPPNVFRKKGEAEAEVDEKKSCQPLGTPMTQGPEKSLCPDDDMHVSPVTSPESESQDETQPSESCRPTSGQPDEPMSRRAQSRAKYGYDKGRGKKSREQHREKNKKKKKENKKRASFH